MNKFERSFPSWMELQKKSDPLNALFDILNFDIFKINRNLRLSLEEHQIINSDLDSFTEFGSYELPESKFDKTISGEYLLQQYISGDYSTISGEVPIYELDSYESLYLPTRADIIEIIDLPIISGEGICFTDSIESGRFLISQAYLSGVYEFDENYILKDIIYFDTAKSSHILNFIPLSGASYIGDFPEELRGLYISALPAIPINYSYFDIYKSGNPLSGVYVSADTVTCPYEFLSDLGTIQFSMDYKLFDFIHRFKTDFLVGNYYKRYKIPDSIIVAQDLSGEYGILAEIPFEDAPYISGTYRFFEVNPLDLLPREQCQIEFAHLKYNHEIVSGNWIHKNITGKILGDSIRLFTEIDNGDDPVFLDPITSFISHKPIVGYMLLYPVDISGIYFDSHFDIYPMAGTYHLVYYTEDVATYAVNGIQSQLPYPDVDLRFQDSAIISDKIYPKTILILTDSNLSVAREMASAPKTAFRVLKKKVYCGIATNPIDGTGMFLTSRGILEDEHGNKFFIKLSHGDDVTLMTSTDYKIGSFIYGDRYARLLPFKNYLLEDDLTFRSMTNYGNNLLILADYNNILYLLVVNGVAPKEENLAVLPISSYNVVRSLKL